MILVLGGTSDSIELANALKDNKHEILLSTATEYGYEVTEQRFHGEIIYGRKSLEELKDLIKQYNIHVVVDATHPFAALISENAIKAAKACSIKYIRYERPTSSDSSFDIIYCSTYEDAGALLQGIDGNILLTTGSKDIDKIINIITEKKRLKVRVLPQWQILKELEGLGLNADNIIAVKGPFSQEMNDIMYRDYNIKVMVCKDSGSAGGTLEKLKAAKRLGIKTVMIARPQLNYPEKYETLKEIIDWFNYRRD